MDEEAFRNLIRGETHGIVAAVARAGLRGLSWGYAAAVNVRNLWLDVNRRRCKVLSVPVISVGNITTGGTGKTPVAAMVIHHLLTMQKSPGIVSRGYRAGPQRCNDEKLVLDQQCPGVPHEQQPDRVAAAKRLIEGFQADVVVMDDGFQHRRLHRDLDIVLIDATNPFGFGYLLPRGLLREPLRGLRRADLVLITRSDLVDSRQRDAFRKAILEEAPGLKDSILEVRFQATRLMGPDGTHRPVQDAAGKSVFLFCGIGNPAGFRATCESLGTTVVGEAVFADHHHYTPTDIERVVEQAARTGADLILTTQKDVVKLAPDTPGVVAVEIGCRFLHNNQEMRFRDMLNERTGKKR